MPVHAATLMLPTLLQGSSSTTWEQLAVGEELRPMLSSVQQVAASLPAARRQKEVLRVTQLLNDLLQPHEHPHMTAAGLVRTAWLRDAAANSGACPVEISTSREM